MLIIVDHRIPARARERLSSLGTLLEFSTEGITYPAISGHPDIFFCQVPGSLIVAPNLPGRYLKVLDENKIAFHTGNLPVGKQYPDSIRYNAASNGEFFVHNLVYTDPVILQHVHYLKKIPVKQGYARCNLALLGDRHFLTSDQGICHALRQRRLEGLLVSPAGIELPDFPNGFIGGAMGILEDRVYFTGSLDRYPEGKRVREYLGSLGYAITELSDGPLRDGGGILFVNPG
jgi:hypothetical protein